MWTLVRDAGLSVVAAIVLAAAARVPARAEEFWLDPVVFMPKAGESVPIVHRRGSTFLGESYPFQRDWFERYEHIDAVGRRVVDGKDGDDPAAELAFERPGLAVLSFHGTPDDVDFDTMDAFRKHLTAEGLLRFERLHLDAAKPLVGIKTQATRHAKTLLGVAGGEGNDRPTGLPLELVAETNPYRLGNQTQVSVRLLLQGKPLAGASIKVFQTDKPGGHVSVVTDQDGRARITVASRDRYLLAAGHMIEPQAGDGVHWDSVWTTLTFLRP